jgi:hypothetical protein
VEEPSTASKAEVAAYARSSFLTAKFAHHIFVTKQPRGSHVERAALTRV